MENCMHYTWQALSAVWITIFGVFIAIASGTVAGPVLWLLALVGVAAPAIILTIDDRRRQAVPAPAAPSPWPNTEFRNIGRGTKGG